MSIYIYIIIYSIFIAYKVKCLKSMLFKLWLLFIQYLQYLKLLYFPRSAKKKKSQKTTYEEYVHLYIQYLIGATFPKISVQKGIAKLT